MRRWLGARVAAGIGIVAALLLVIVAAWWTRGIAEATALFQLLQGVILATLGWLYGSQGLERAEAEARAEMVARRGVDEAASEAREGVVMLAREGRRASAVLARLAEDPALRSKVEEATREIEERWP